MKTSKDIRIGVMSVQHEGRPPFGMQTYFFEDMVKSVKDLQKQIFFFSPLDFKQGSNSVVGYQFVENEWIEKSAIVPKLIYDRSFSRDETDKQTIENCRARLASEGKYILNPFDFAELLNDKVSFHALLMENHVATLETFPFSILQESRFIEALNASRFYIKPTFGSKGQGIFVVEKVDSEFGLIDNEGMLKMYPSYDALLTTLNASIDKNTQYFVQQEAQLVQFDKAPFDIRVLVQNEGASYLVAGKAVRVGQKGAVTSNLNSGGKALPFQELSVFFEDAYGYDIDELETEIDALCLKCAHMLKTSYGEFCEIGFDVLITKDAGPIILEGNAKPSRWVFVKIADYLQAKGLDPSIYVEKRKRTTGAPMRYAKYLLDQENF